PVGRLGALAVVVGYVDAASAALARENVVTSGVACLVLAVTIRGYAGAAGPDRRARVTAVFAAAVLALALAGGSVARLAGVGAGPPRRRGYQAAPVPIPVGVPAACLFGG